MYLIIPHNKDKVGAPNSNKFYLFLTIFDLIKLFYDFVHFAYFIDQIFIYDNYIISNTTMAGITTFHKPPTLFFAKPK